MEAIISAKLAQLTLGLHQEIAALKAELTAQADRSRRDNTETDASIVQESKSRPTGNRRQVLVSLEILSQVR